MIRVRFGIAATLLLALFAPVRFAAAQETNAVDDAYFDMHTISATVRGFEFSDQNATTTIGAFLVILDDDKPAERFFDDVVSAIIEPDNDTEYESVPLDLDLPSREAEAVLYQSVPDPDALFDLGFATAAVRLDNVLLYCLIIGGGDAAEQVTPIFEVFIENAITADDDNPASYLPETSDLPDGYTKNGPDEQLYPKEANS